MAFSLASGNQNGFGNPSAVPGRNLQVRTDPDLEEIHTEALGFLALGGEAKVQLLPSPWPSDNLPPPTASLMSIASQRGLLAAAGPDAVVVASTDSIRKAFHGPKSSDSEVRSFHPHLTLPMSMRVSQVTFTADGNYLVLSAEIGGGLAVYEVQTLLSGSTEAAFEMPTNSLSLRALVANPTPEKGEFLALVTTDGKLMMANLKERNFISGASGQILKDGVSCVSWSTKGRQLVAGLGDGSCVQLTPEGDEKGEIPRSPNIDQNYYVSSITWLENNVFLTVSTPSNFDRNSTSVFNIITRQPPLEFVFRKLDDPAGPFGLERYPPHHFLLRLKEFPPNLQDLIIVASSASTDIGLFSRSKTALVADKPADKVTGVFTRTELYDARRAQMSMTDDNLDTSPIGVGLDLSSKEKVVRPIPSDEMDESPTPVPALMVLNNNGVIASWWVIYSESIKQGTSYPGLVIASEVEQSTQPARQHTLPSTVSAPNVASNSVYSRTEFSSSNQTASFGSPSPLGTNTSSAFGSPSGINRTQSPWAQPASSSIPKAGVAFGTPSFGSTSALNSQGVTFGTAALPGNRVSLWNTAIVKPPSTTFGQPPGIGMTGSPNYGNTSGVGLFGSGSTIGTISSSGGFASFADKGGGGFAAAAVAAAGGNGANAFGPGSSTSAFSAPVSNLGNESSSTFFGGNLVRTENLNGLVGAGGFKLGSTFKPDGSAGHDDPKPIDNGNSFFSSGLGNALVDAQKASMPVIDEADMDADDPELEPGPQQNSLAKTDPDSEQLMPTNQEFFSSTTPKSTPATPEFPLPISPSEVRRDFFGTIASSEAPATMPAESKESTFSFENLNAVPNEPQTSNSVETSPIQAAAGSGSLEIKKEPPSDEEHETNIHEVPEAPLPPEPTSKATYFVGESSVSSVEPDAPLPPDFLPAAVPEKAKELTSPALDEHRRPSPELLPQTYVADDPEEEQGSDFGNEEDDQNGHGSEEGSGEDIAEDISPTSELQQTPGYTPQSSFGGSSTRVNGDNLFTKIPPQSEHAGVKALFGEIDKSNTSIFPPTDQFSSPRSPSPVRTSIPNRLRHGTSRSSSAPNIASIILGRPPELDRPSIAYVASLEQRKAEEARKAEIRTRKEAEETQALIDREDESIQNFLKKEIVGNKTLDDFIAHQDYVGQADKGQADKDSIPAQVEAVYCDINSMVDTLGVNSRSLKSFIKGHTELRKASRRMRQDFEDVEDWCLGEIDYLSQIITRDLTQQLEEGLIKNMPSKLKACVDLERDLAKLRAKYEDVKMLLASYTDPENSALARSQPLAAEQAVQQHDLRRDFTKFQKLLTEAEEGLILLRVKLTSQGTANGSETPGPTVEAVLKTVMKMTSMAEKRSGDIDVLENQMRKLRLGSVTSNGSREASPFATPASKASMRTPATLGIYNAFYTPNSTKDTPHRSHASFMSSTHSYSRGTPPRKKVSGFSEEDKQRLRSNMIRKQAITDRLKRALERNGVRVQSMDRD